VTHTDHAQLAAQRTLARINEIIVVVITVAALVGVLVGGESGRVIDAIVVDRRRRCAYYARQVRNKGEKQ